MNKDILDGSMASGLKDSLGKKAVTYILGVIASLCIIVASVVISVEVNITDDSFFINEYIIK